MGAGRAAVLVAALTLLAAVGADAGKILLTYPNSNTLLRASTGPGLRDGKVVGSPIGLPSKGKIGRILYTAVSEKSGLAFTASVKYDSSSARGTSYLTVTDTNGSKPKVVKTFQLGGLRTGDLAGCPLAERGSIAIETIGVSHHVFLTLGCLQKCRGSLDRSYVIKYSYSSASKNLAGPSSAYKWLVTQHGCSAAEKKKERRVLQIHAFPKYVNGQLKNGTIFAVIGPSRTGVAPPALYLLENRQVIPTGVTAKLPVYYAKGGQCGGPAEIASPTAFFATCQQPCAKPCGSSAQRKTKNSIVYATKGKSAATIGGGSTALSAGAFGPLSIGTPSVVYGLKTVAGKGSYVTAHAKSGSFGSSFVSAFRVPSGASDLDAF